MTYPDTGAEAVFAPIPDLLIGQLVQLSATTIPDGRRATLSMRPTMWNLGDEVTYSEARTALRAALDLDDDAQVIWKAGTVEAADVPGHGDYTVTVHP